MAGGGLVQDVRIEAERLAIGEHEVSLSEDIPGTMQIRGDPEQIYRVVSNLVRNARQAIEATGQNGTVEIGAGENADISKQSAGIIVGPGRG